MLNRLGGAARTGDLLAAGCGEAAIGAAVRSGLVTSPVRGVLIAPGAPPSSALAVRLNAGLTCVSALAAAGIPLPRGASERIHLAVHRSFSLRGRPANGARFHHQVARPEPGKAVSIAEALDTAGDCLDEMWHLIAVDAALNRGLITMGDVMSFRRTSRERREFLISFADGRSQAPGETIARLVLAQAGHRVRPQAHIEGAGAVDLEVDGILLVQVDGYEFHSDRPTFRRDRQKGRAIVKAGRPLLSYAASELLGSSRPDIVAEVRAALANWRARTSRA